MYAGQKINFGIDFTKRKQPLTIVLGAFLLAGFSLTPTIPRAQPFQVGQQVFNACQTVAVLGGPADYWSVLRRLKFGAPVRIASLTGKYELPASDNASKENAERRAEDSQPGRGADLIDPMEYTRHAWLDIGLAEFVPANCFVTEKLYKQQNTERARKKIAAIATRRGKKGFSEDEEGDLKAMKGAAGQVSGGKANYPEIDKHLNATTALLGTKLLKKFMKTGGLM